MIYAKEKSLFDLEHFGEFGEYYNKYVDGWGKIYEGIPTWKDTKSQTIRAGSKKRTLNRLSTARFIASELAGLIWAENCSINVSTAVDKNYTQEKIDRILIENDFDSRLRKFIELYLAYGGGAVKTWVDGTTVRISFYTAKSFIPTHWNDTRVTGGAFIRQDVRDGYQYTTIERHVHTLKQYEITNLLYRSKIDKVGGGDVVKWQAVPLSTLYKDLQAKVVFHDVKHPFFSYLTPNTANPFRPYTPFGVSIYAGVEDLLKGMDLCFDSLLRDFSLGKKRIIIPQTALSFNIGENEPMFDIDDEVFSAMQIGDDLDTQRIHEMDFSLRVDEHEQAIGVLLGLIEAHVGLSVGSFAFDRSGGVRTATEVISEKSKTFRTVRNHQKPLRTALFEMVENILILSKFYNFTDRVLDVQPDIKINFDDSIIESQEANISAGMSLVSQGLLSKFTFLVDRMGYTEEQAKQEIQRINAETQTVEDDLTALFGNHEAVIK